MISEVNRLISSQRWTSIIDPISFYVTSVLAFKKLRELEWINGPVTLDLIALTGAVNSLTLYLSHHIAKSNKHQSSLYQTVITIIGFGVGATLAPMSLPKL